MEVIEFNESIRAKAVKYFVEKEYDVNGNIISLSQVNNTFDDPAVTSVAAMIDGEIIGSIMGMIIPHRDSYRFTVIHTIINEEYRGGKVLLKLINKVKELTDYPIFISFPTEWDNKRFKKVSYVYEVI